MNRFDVIDIITKKFRPLLCATGQYVSAGVCYLCPKGKYSTSTSVTSCTPCAAGTYAATTGLSQCTSVPGGSLLENVLIHGKIKILELLYFAEQVHII